MGFAASVSRDLLASYLSGLFAAGVLCAVAALSLQLLKRCSGQIVLTPRSA